jgi:large subunit ribosomal protein L10
LIYNPFLLVENVQPAGDKRISPQTAGAWRQAQYPAEVKTHRSERGSHVTWLKVFARQYQGKDFFILKTKGGETQLAFSKKHKKEMYAEYQDLLAQSQGVFVLEYKKMTVKDVQALRSRVRETGGSARIIKNTLMDLALKGVGIKTEKALVGTCLFGFALKDVPGVAKIFTEVAKNSEIFKLKGGYMDKQILTPEQVKSLADLPPLPVMRSKLLGLLNAPASKLVRTLAEPARSLASVLKAHSDKEAAPAAV